MLMFKIPVPVNHNRALFLSMNWVIRTAQGREKRWIHMEEQLAYELIDASNNVVKIVFSKFLITLLS